MPSRRPSTTRSDVEGVARRPEQRISAGRATVPEANGTTLIVVDTRDRFGNELARGGAKVKLRASGGELRSVRDLRNGNYAAILRRRNAEEQKVVVTGSINRRRIKDTAVVFFR